MGCGASTVDRVPSSKRLSSNPLNKMGGHAHNLDKGAMEGVLTLNIGTCKNLNLTSVKNAKNLHVIASFGAQTFKSGYSNASASCSWDDVCHIWVQEHQLEAKVLVGVYSGPSLVGMNYIEMKGLMTYAKKEDRMQRLLKCTLFPEAVFRGEKFTESQSLGEFSLQADYHTRAEMLLSFWNTMFLSVDHNGDKVLDMEEFKDMIQLVTETTQNGSNKPGAPPLDVAKLFAQSDINKDNKIQISEICGLVSVYPDLVGNDALYSHLVEQYFHSDRAKAMTGGFVTREHAQSGWAYQASEWMGLKETYGVGLNVDGKASRIHVWDRENGCMIQEKISPAINMAMRSMYQTKPGRTMLYLPSTTAMMKEGTEQAGRYEDDPKSAEKIPKFIKAMAINTSEILDPLDSFKTYNEFFTRKLKPETRPIAEPDNPRMVVQPADSRLSVFSDIDSCTTLWVKGREFTMAKLLHDEQLAKHFEGGSIAISRLAPQDYHRFHAPVDGKVVSISPVVGKQYWTVNPVAINSPMDVFGENVRRVCLIESPIIGKVAYICVGATMVASIVFTGMQEGKEVKKGDDLGTFKFGGSTVICVFEKGAIEFDKVLMDNSLKSTETYVKMGSSLGTKL